MARSVDEFLDPTEHDARSHAGVSGVPAAEAFTQAAHGTQDHSGILGVGTGVNRCVIGSFYGGAVSDGQVALPAGYSANFPGLEMPAAGTLESFRAAIFGGGSATWEILKNGGVVATTTGNTHAMSVAFVAGDLIGVRMLTGPGGSSIVRAVIGGRFA